MKCDDFKKQLTDLFDVNPDKHLVKVMKEHMETCHDCQMEYMEMKSVSKALEAYGSNFSADSDFPQSVLNTIKNKKMENRKKNRKIIRYAGIAASFALLIAVLFFTKATPFVTSAKAAETILQKSLTAMESLRSMFITMEARTENGESFDVINVDNDFSEYEIWKQFSGNMPWKMKKAGREIAWDGDKKYLYLSGGDYAVTAGKDYDMEGWLGIFLDPRSILETEINFAKKHKAEYDVEETSGDIILTIYGDALGDFNNNYLKNKSVLESNNTRKYTFEKNTKLLKSFELFVNLKGTSVKVIDVFKIAYNIPISAETFAINLPPGVTWQEIQPQVYVKRFTNITPKEAAGRFFKALKKGEFADVEKVWGTLAYSTDYEKKEIEEKCKDLEIISLGEPFKSGLYPGYFVPYKIKFMDGDTVEFNLAIRNDNKNKTWNIDGGF